MCAEGLAAAGRERGPASVRHHMATIWPPYGHHMAAMQPRLTAKLSRGKTAQECGLCARAAVRACVRACVRTWADRRGRPKVERTLVGGDRAQGARKRVRRARTRAACRLARPPPPGRQATKLLPVPLCERFQAYDRLSARPTSARPPAPPKPKVRARPRRTVR
jgi:hypothetical protein